MQIKRKELAVALLLYAVLAFYVLLLVLILFRQHHSARSFNLIPLRGIISYLTGIDLVTGDTDPTFMRGLAFSNLLGNIVIFIPLGVYVTLLHKRKEIWRNTLMIAAVSAVVEILQFAFLFGIGDIDDVILNTLGGLIGVLLCKGIYQICKNDAPKARTVVALLAPAAGALSFAILILINR